MACQGCEEKEAEITNLLHKLAAWEADYVHKDKLQAARLDAARRIHRHIAASSNHLWVFWHDEDLLRIIGDAPAGEVMPSVPTDHPVRDSRPGEYVAVGEEASQREDAPAVIREMTDKVPVSGQPSAGCGTAEPPRPDPAEPHKCQRNGCKACWDNGYDNGRLFIIGVMIGDLQRHGFDAAAKHLYARYNPSAIGQTMEEDTNV